MTSAATRTVSSGNQALMEWLTSRVGMACSVMLDAGAGTVVSVYVSGIISESNYVGERQKHRTLDELCKPGAVERLCKPFTEIRQVDVVFKRAQPKGPLATVFDVLLGISNTLTVTATVQGGQVVGMVNESFKWLSDPHRSTIRRAGAEFIKGFIAVVDRQFEPAFHRDVRGRIGELASSHAAPQSTRPEWLRPMGSVARR